VGSGFRTFTAGEVLTASNVQNYLMDQSVMVFGGSAARSSAIGTANFEEGMISYLTDTDKVEAYNGTNWAQVGASAQGLTLINTTSFSGVSSVTLANDTFSSTYRAYKIIIDITSGTAQEVLLLRMTSAGTPVTTAVYDRNHSYQAPSTGGTWNDDQSGDNQTSIRMSAYPTTGNIIDFNVYNPFETKITQVLGINFSATGGLYLGGARVETTTSYDGLQFFTGLGTMTGNYQVYGFNR
jgi:hypothetical protein